MNISSQTMIEGCCAGDRSSQEMLYATYSRRMMGLCMWYSKNRQEAEEILQDGFLRVYRYIRNYKGEGSLESWIRQIMINTALQKLAPRLKMKPLLRFKTELPDIPDEYSVLDLLSEKELLLLVQHLTPVYRIVFTLHVMEGMKHREIAKLLNISEGTSKSNLADARKAIQKMLLSQSQAYLTKSRQL